MDIVLLDLYLSRVERSIARVYERNSFLHFAFILFKLLDESNSSLKKVISEALLNAADTQPPNTNPSNRETRPRL